MWRTSSMASASCLHVAAAAVGDLLENLHDLRPPATSTPFCCLETTPSRRRRPHPKLAVARWPPFPPLPPPSIPCKFCFFFIYHVDVLNWPLLAVRQYNVQWPCMAFLLCWLWMCPTLDGFMMLLASDCCIENGNGFLLNELTWLNKMHFSSYAIPSY
jgi:hypothetical protein